MRYLLLLTIFCSSLTFSQEEEIIQLPVSKGPKAGDGEIFTIVEEQPEYPGGFGEMMKFIQSNFEYPAIAKEMGDEGTVYVQFVVEKDGSISNVKAIRGVTEELDAESIRVVKAMPTWSPGKQKGRPVRARFTLPIRCKLSDPAPKKPNLTPARYPGSFTDMIQHTMNELKYPEDALKYGETGDVKLEFSVSETGKISNVKVVESAYPSLEKEAIRIVNTFPDYIPAKKDGVNVPSVAYMLIPFNLEKKAIKKGQKLKLQEEKKRLKEAKKKK